MKTTEHLIKMHSDCCFSIKPEALFITVFIIMGFNGKVPAVVQNVGLFIFYCISLFFVVKLLIVGVFYEF